MKGEIMLQLIVPLSVVPVLRRTRRVLLPVAVLLLLLLLSPNCCCCYCYRTSSLLRLHHPTIVAFHPQVVAVRYSTTTTTTTTAHQHHYHHRSQPQRNGKLYHSSLLSQQQYSNKVTTTTRRDKKALIELWSTTGTTSSSNSIQSPSHNNQTTEVTTTPIKNDTIAVVGPWNQLLTTIRSLVTTKDGDNNDKVTFRQKLTKMGIATLLSYGFVSNMSYAITVSCAWYIQNVQTKQSPFYPGQWKSFIIIYSGFWMFNNIIRPIRLGISMTLIAPQFDRILLYIQHQYQLSRTMAIAVLVILANVVGTISAMSFGIFIASLLSGVPIFP